MVKSPEVVIPFKHLIMETWGSVILSQFLCGQGDLHRKKEGSCPKKYNESVARWNARLHRLGNTCPSFQYLHNHFRWTCNRDTATFQSRRIRTTSTQASNTHLRIWGGGHTGWLNPCQLDTAFFITPNQKSPFSFKDTVPLLSVTAYWLPFSSSPSGGGGQLIVHQMLSFPLKTQKTPLYKHHPAPWAGFSICWLTL